MSVQLGVTVLLVVGALAAVAVYVASQVLS